MAVNFRSWVPFAHTWETSSLSFWRQMALDILMAFAHLPFNNLYATSFTVRPGCCNSDSMLVLKHKEGATWGVNWIRNKGYSWGILLPTGRLQAYCRLPIGPKSRPWGPEGASMDPSNSTGILWRLDRIGIVSRSAIVIHANCHFKFHNRSWNINVRGGQSEDIYLYI